MVDLLKREELLLGSNNQTQIDQSYQEFLSILKIPDPQQCGQKLEKFRTDPQKVSNVQIKVLQTMNAKLCQYYEEKPFKILFPLSRLQAGKTVFVRCQAFVGSHNCECLVTCAKLDKDIIKPSPAEEKTGQIDLLEHLPKLMPTSGRGIGVYTFQNGINNTFKNFTDMAHSILKNLPERPLCIGLYNPCKGLFNDVCGVLSKLNGILSESVCATQAMFQAIANRLSSHPQYFWAHIAHSEGGLIAQTTLTLLKNKPMLAKYLRTRLYTLTFGAVLPISRQYAMGINCYSKGDIATWPRVRQMLKDLGEEAKDYDIRLLDAIVAEVEPYPQDIPNNFAQMPFSKRMHLVDQMARESQYGLYEIVTAAAYVCSGGDHGFQNDTYKFALRDYIKEIKLECLRKL